MCLPPYLICRLWTDPKPHSHELFDEYTRRQFLAKAPEKNLFGTEETPARFADFDVFKKVCMPPPETEELNVDHVVSDSSLARHDADHFDEPRALAGADRGAERHGSDKLGSLPQSSLKTSKGQS